MGSVAVGDVVSDLTRFPPSMMVGNRPHDSSSAESERNHHPHPHPHPHHHHSASADTSANAPPRSAATPQHRSSSSEAATPSTERRASGAGAREASQHAQPPPIDVPGRSRAPRNATSRDQARTDDRGEARERADMDTNESAEHGQEAGGVQYGASPPSPQLRPTIRSAVSLTNPGSPAKIVVRNLNHIQSFASEEVLTRSRHGSRRSLRGRMEGSQQYEISSMPVTDIIEMVAGLLTKITTTNDRPGQHENLHRHLPSSEPATSARHMQMQSVLSFHGRNIPSITILSYLSRIHRYCPTTYEVFLSLLVYFDRMTEAVNNGTLKSFKSVEEAFGEGNPSNANHATSPLQTPPASGSIAPQDSDHESSLVDSDDEPEDQPPDHAFVVDSYNIHRLVIAGVTCASKFFSDVFYTNSRYAKVGGLPIHELNHLELQFLLLNDYRLSVPVEELEAYGSRLVEFYAREVVAQQQTAHSNGNGTGPGAGAGTGTGSDALYMQNQESAEA